MQLERNELLSASQIYNIENGYSDDLGKIILSLNDELKSQLSNSVEIVELVDDADFSLSDYLSERCSDKPVIVDLWNTWCGPCMYAHKETEDLRLSVNTGDIVFLYLSDETSPQQEWKPWATRIGGIQLRLNEQSFSRIIDEYQAEGIPFYLVFDRNHCLLYKQTGFSGVETYQAWLDEASGAGNGK